MLTGPAGSGKTFRVLQQFREAIARGDAGVRLFTPTATMAQHLQHRMAREGYVFRATLVQTFSRFTDSLVPDLPQVSRPLFYLIVEEAARRAGRKEFAAVVRLPGFCAALARTMEELSSAGCDAERLAQGLRDTSRAPLGEAFLAVYRETARDLRRRGLATRSDRLRHAAEAIARGGLGSIHTIWLDGFHALPDPELAVIAALSRHADVTVTMPDSTVTEPTRERLLAIGFGEERCAWRPAPADRVLVEAPSIEREADEIARRILAQIAGGREFHEMGVVVRSPATYEAILRTTFDRFGIPARFYLDADLARHPAVRFLSAMLDALLSGWDHESTLHAVRLAPGVPSDEFDFTVRRQIPGMGLDGLIALAGEPPNAVADLLRWAASMDEWRAAAVAPAEWAARLSALRAWFETRPLEPAGFEAAADHRSLAVALQLFGEAMTEAAAALPGSPASLAQFWHAARSVLRLTPLRVEDLRRNVVSVLDAHEARNWQLPVIFVCGLVEKEFPRFHAQDPFLPETARLELKQAGIRLRSAADFESEERFLFDRAVTRATASLILSYPRTDARSQPNLPSLFLEEMPAAPSQPAVPRRAAPPRAAAGLAITSADLLANIALRHQPFQLTALESYLQCPFQFFARHTLRLEGAPLRPNERLDFRTQGSIVHATLAEVVRGDQPLEAAFARTFDRFARRHNLVGGYRTEALRERMLADLRALVNGKQWLLGREMRVEQEFHLPLGEGLEIKGRIDRIDVMPDGSAYVIDYKYSGAQNTRNRARDENLLQPQIYMRALEHHFHLKPAGMSYWGFKGGIQQTPWTPFDPARALETAWRIAAEIRLGTAAVKPADVDKCRLCDFADVCRFVEAEPAAEGAGQWD